LPEQGTFEARMTSLNAILVLALLGVGDPVAAPPRELPPLTGDLARLRELLYGRHDPLQQSQAALLLLQSGTAEGRREIDEALRRWDRPDVFQAASSAVRLRRDSTHAATLFKALGAEKLAIRQSAIDTVARLEVRLILRPLVALAEDPNASLLARQSAAAALGRTMQRSAVTPLLSLLSSDALAVRQAAAAALEELTGQTHGADVAAWTNWWAQQKDLTDDEWLAARNAFLADRARRVRDELARAENELVQVHQMLYAKIPAADRPSHLQLLTQSDYAAVRLQAIAWIIEALPGGDPALQKQLTTLLLRLTEDGVEAVQRNAVLALERQLGDPLVFQRLLSLLETGNVNVRAAAARGLGRHRATRDNTELTARAVAALEKALRDDSLVVVAEAAESLGTIGAPEAVAILAGLLRHPSDAVRQAAGRALEQVANLSVLQELYAGLRDPSANVRFNVVGALARVGSGANVTEQQRADIVRGLQSVMLKDGDPGVRSRAATVIGDLGTVSDLTFLWQRAATTEDERVKAKAWQALIEILARSGSLELVTQWEQMLANQRAHVARAELLNEVRIRWLKVEGMRGNVDAVTASLVHAQLAQRKWSLAMPLALDLARRAPNEAELKKRLRWLLTAGNQAVDDKKPRDTLQMLKEAEDLLARAGELAYEFDVLRKRADEMSRADP
jgi:HEAT repeat protein